VKISRRSSLTK